METNHVFSKLIVVPFLLFFLALTSCNDMPHPTDSEALQSSTTTQPDAATGIGQMRLDKPTKEWCENNGYENYGQCVKTWAHKGEVLFVEHFEDTDFASRGWYDVRAGAVLTTENPAPGTNQVLECTYEQGGQRCADGYPLRVEIEETESVYLSYWVRYSDNWVGSQRPYHPHEFHFTTNKDSEWVGPANSHLTMYIEQVDLTPMIALQDSRNVDSNCILLNNDNFSGCDGNFDTYPFTEARSVASCNGLDGFLDQRDCFFTGSYWYSARKWSAPSGPAFIPGEWHFVEALLNMNDIVDGKGIPNGSIRYWVDGEIRIASDEILFRTAVNSDMAFKYLLFAPWIGDGSPLTQTMWVGEITVATNVF